MNELLKRELTFSCPKPEQKTVQKPKESGKGRDDSKRQFHLDNRNGLC